MKHLKCILYFAVFAFLAVVIWQLIDAKTNDSQQKGNSAFIARSWTSENKSIFIYGPDGHIIETYHGTIKFNRESSWVNIITSDNQSVIVHGGVIIVKDRR